MAFQEKPFEIYSPSQKILQLAELERMGRAVVRATNVQSGNSIDTSFATTFSLPQRTWCYAKITASDSGSPEAYTWQQVFPDNVGGWLESDEGANGDPDDSPAYEANGASVTAFPLYVQLWFEQDGSAYFYVPGPGDVNPLPPPPTSVTSGNPTKTTVDVSYLLPEGTLTGYVYYSRTPHGHWYIGGAQVTSTYTVIGLLPDTDYWFVVTAYNGQGGQGIWGGPPTHSKTFPLHSTWHYADAYLTPGASPIYHTADAWLHRTLQVVHYADAKLWGRFTVDHTADSWLHLTLPITHTTDAFLRTPGEMFHEVDSFLRVPGQMFHRCNSFVRSPGHMHHRCNSYLRYPGETQHYADAFLRYDGKMFHTCDSFLRSPGAMYHTSDAWLHLTNTVVHTADAYLVSSGGGGPYTPLGTGENGGGAGDVTLTNLTLSAGDVLFVAVGGSDFSGQLLIATWNGNSMTASSEGVYDGGAFDGIAQGWYLNIVSGGTGDLVVSGFGPGAGGYGLVCASKVTGLTNSSPSVSGQNDLTTGSTITCSGQAGAITFTYAAALALAASSTTFTPSVGAIGQTVTSGTYRLLELWYQPVSPPDAASITLSPSAPSAWATLTLLTS